MRPSDDGTIFTVEHVHSEEAVSVHAHGDDQAHDHAHGRVREPALERIR